MFTIGVAVADDTPDYTVYRARPRGLRERLRGEAAPVGNRDPKRQRGSRGRKTPWSPIRVLKFALMGAVGWVLLSAVLFLISAHSQEGKGISQEAKAALAKGGFPPLTPTTILVLGSDKRPKGSKEPGARASGQRSDTIMLLRVGGGASSKLSIPRDTVVPIPGHGVDKINSAYAYGGAALSIKTVSNWTGISIDHLIEVNLENFPKFIDALGGITVKTPCVISDINGGTRNGGVSIRLHKGENDLNGKQSLAYARTRHNRCDPSYSDIDRVRAQQQIIGGMRTSLLSLGGFIRLPWAAWAAPQAINTDVGALELSGIIASIVVSGSPPPKVLKPTGAVTLSNGGAGLVVSDSAKQRAVDQFLNG